MSMLDKAALDRLFLEARSYNGWLDKAVSEDQLKHIFELTKMGPTSANTSPLRIVFVKSKEQKDRLMPMLDKGNQEKTRGAPVTAILAHDRKFYEHLPRLFPHKNARPWFEGKADKIEETMWRNGTLQAGYFIMAVRAVGLDCGAMSGFNADAVKEAFFPDLDGEVNFLCNIGYGDPASIFARSPRFDFEDVCRVV